MSFPRYFCPNLDLKVQIQEIRKSLPPKVVIFPLYVEGHLDDEKDFLYDGTPQQVPKNKPRTSVTNEHANTSSNSEQR